MTRKELLFGMAEKTNNRIGPHNIGDRLAWYKTRAEKLAAEKDTKQVVLARLTNQDRIDLLVELYTAALKGKDAI